VKTLVTGSAGFAGKWLAAELAAAGHQVHEDRTASGRIDITDAMAVEQLLATARPDLVIHLAAVSFGPQAELDARTALRVNVGGTAILLQAIAAMAVPAAIVVVSSAEVYEPPGPDAQPLTEAAPLRPTRVYGLTKLAQEATAVEIASTRGLRLAIVRPFNHTGPGQRPAFAVPAFAARILDARATGRASIVAGNIDVIRDIGDVRDTVRAYRLLGEALVGGLKSWGPFNVATGSPVAIRSIIDRLAVAAEHPVSVEVDPDLVRPDDPVRIVGDASALRALTGWTPAIPFDTTLRDVLDDVARRGA
jgi:GDP-4-dehydro-6-deoxy-D-mannose reductase